MSRYTDPNKQEVPLYFDAGLVLAVAVGLQYWISEGKSTDAWDLFVTADLAIGVWSFVVAIWFLTRSDTMGENYLSRAATSAIPLCAAAMDIVVFSEDGLLPFLLLAVGKGLVGCGTLAHRSADYFRLATAGVCILLVLPVAEKTGPVAGGSLFIGSILITILLMKRRWIGKSRTGSRFVLSEGPNTKQHKYNSNK